MADSSNPGVTMPWKRPWSLEEVRQGASTWSLAGDSGLYLLLEQMSKNVVDRTNDLEREVEGIISESKAVDIEAQNAFNDFCMLANIQYIENLVEEEDPTQASATANGVTEDKPQKSREEQQADLMPFVRQTLQLGLKVLENQYERVEVRQERGWTNEDLDDEDDLAPNTGNSSRESTVEPIYQPRDPYENRHLPHMIGSVAFRDDDTLGIGYIDDYDDDEDIQEESETEDSLTADENMKKDGTSRRNTKYSSVSSFTTSSDESDMESKHKKSTASKKQPLTQSSVSKIPIKDDNMFGDTDSDDDSDFFGDEVKSSPMGEPEAKKTQPGNSLADELKRKLGANSSSPTDGSQSPALLPSSRGNEATSRKNRGPSTLSTTQKPAKEPVWSDEEEEDDNLFGKTALFNPKASLFSPSATKGASLFDDDDDEDLGRKTSNMPTSQPAKKPQPNDNDDDDLFASVKKTSKPAAPSSQAASSKKQPDSSSDDDDLFGTKTTKPSVGKSSVKPVSTTKTKDLFSDEEDDLFSASKKPVIKTEEKKKTEQKSKNSLFESSRDDDDDLFSAISGPKSSAQPTSSSTSKKTAQPSLFNDSEDEDDFLSAMTKTKSKTIEAPSKSSAPPAKSNTLAAPKTKSLFDNEDDNLFAQVDKSTPKSSLTTAGNKKSDDLFDENNEEEPLSSASKKRPVGGVSMFGGVNPLAVAKENAKNTEAIERRASKLTAPSDDLFDEIPPIPKPSAAKVQDPPAPKPEPSTPAFQPPPLVSDDDDDLFGGKSKQPSSKPTSVAKTTAPIPKSTPAFSDSDDFSDLFKATPKSSASNKPQTVSSKKDDDLFGETSSKAPVSKPSVATQPKSALPPDDDDDLFGGGFSKTATKKAPVSKPLEADNDLFGNGSAVKSSTKKPPISKPASDDADLLGDDKPKLANQPKLTSQEKPKGLTFDDDDDDELFGPPKTKPSVSKTATLQAKSVDDDLFGSVKPAAKPVPISTVKKVEDIFTSEKRSPASGKSDIGEDEDVLFGTQKNTNILEKTSVVPKEATPPVDTKPVEESEDPVVSKPKYKPPPGAVSMFGGANMMASASRNLANEMNARLKKNKPVESDSEDETPQETKKPADEDAEESKPRRQPFQLPPGAVSMFGGPMMGGPRASASAASTEPEKGLDFDTPIENSVVLQSATKSRARPSLSRKRPSMFAGLPSSGGGLDPIFDQSETKKSEEKPPSLDNQPKTAAGDDIFASSKPQSKPVKADDEEDIFSTAKQSKPKSLKPPADDDIFASFKPTTSGTSKAAVSKDDEDDLFSFKPKSSTQLKKPDAADDIFGSIPNDKKKADSEDIFKEPPRPVDDKAKKNEPKKVDDDDDLFAIPAPKSATSSSKATEKSKIVVKLDSDEEDLFSAPVIKRQAKSQKKANEALDRLFADETDIFSDLPTASKVTKASKTKSKKSAPPITDDLDDIFATKPSSSKSGPPGSKKSNKTKSSASVTKPTPVTSGDIDPLGAL